MVRKALESLWKDRCTIVQKVKAVDPVTKITKFSESELLANQPCKLSFETLSSNGGDHIATVSQAAKLFLSADVVVPDGCKIIVTRPNGLERVLTYSKSGEPGVFSNHQEINLSLFKEWA